MRNLFHRFPGGFYPSHRKSPTRKKQILALPDPEELVVPLRAAGCPPCAPAVQAGQAVQEGELLGRAEADGVPVYAPVSGQVLRFGSRLCADGALVPSVTLACSLQPEDVPLPSRRLTWERPAGDMPAAELADAVRRIGIGCADGGTAPLHRRLAQAAGRVRLLIVNGCESEPLVTAEHRVMAQWPEDVIGGAGYLMRLLRAERCIIAVESNKSDAISALQDKLPLRGGSIRVQPLRARFPQGMDKPLIYSLTGQALPLDKTPLELGCMIVKAGTAAAVCQGLEQGLPFTRRVITVTGSAVECPQNYWAPLGVTAEYLLQAAGGCKSVPRCVVAGGPMTGRAVTDLSTPLEGGVSALLAMGPGEPAGISAHPRCLRCGRCMEVCPMNLLPLYYYLYRDRAEQLRSYHLEYCMECGGCTYVCPSQVPLADCIRRGKALLRQEEGEN